MASLHQKLAMSKQKRGEFEDAFAEFEQEKQVMQQLMERHPDVGGLSFNWSNHVHRYASALLAADDVEEAELMLSPHLQWLAQQQEKYPQLIHLLRITEVECRELMSRIHHRQDRIDESQSQLDAAMEICEQECESDQAPLGMRVFLGHLYAENAKKMLERDERESAVVACNRAIEILEPIVETVPAGDPAVYLDQARQILQDSLQGN